MTLGLNIRWLKANSIIMLCTVMMVGLAPFGSLYGQSFPSFSSPATAQKGAELVKDASYSLISIWQDAQVQPHIKPYFPRAKAVVIVPKSIAGGLILSGELGEGVMLARTMNGGWSYPAFVQVGSASVGFQGGARSTATIYLIMTNEGLNAILNDEFRLGGEINGAVGYQGIGADAGSSTDINLDVLSFSVSAGLYLGAGLEGTIIRSMNEQNQAYYGQAYAIKDIVMQGAAQNPQADGLRQELSQLQ